MNELAPVKKGKARKKRPSLEHMVHCYEDLYVHDTMTSHPRTEAFTAACVSALAGGLFFSVIARFGSDIHHDYAGLLLWFFGSVIWYLGRATALATAIMHEAALRLTWNTRYFVDPLYGSRLIDKILSEVHRVLLVTFIVCLGWLVFELVNLISPPAYIRQVPYTGGG